MPSPRLHLDPTVEGSLKQIDPQNREKVGESFVEPNPMKRFGKPEEVAPPIAFLHCGDAGFINAAVISIDDGQSYKD